MDKKFVSAVIALLVLTQATSLFAGTMISIPGLGDVGFEKKDGSTYSVGIPQIGTFDFKGVYNSSSDFDLMAELPISALTDYIPVIGQILGVLGLDSATYRLTQNGFGLKIHLEEGGLGMFREYIVEELWLFDWQRVGTEALIASLELKNFDMETMFRGKTLNGKVSGDFSIIGMDLGFGVDGTISFEAIVKSIVNKIVPVAKDYVARYAKEAYNKSRQAVSRVGNWGIGRANSLINQVGVIAHDLSASVSHGGHSFDRCYNECTVNYANSQRNPLLQGSNQIFQDFYNQIYKDVRNIEGATDAETLSLRKAAVDGDWFNLVNKFNAEWQKVYDDDEVENYFFSSSSERKARDRYRQMIKEYWDQHKTFVNNLYNQLMTIKAPVRIPRNPRQAYRLLKDLARTGTAVQFLHCEEDFAWDNPWNNHFYDDHVSVYLFTKHEGWNQLWYLHPAGRDNAYYIQSAQTGKYLHLRNGEDRQGTTIVTASGYGEDATSFKAVADEKGYITWHTKNGNVFDMANGSTPVSGADLQLWSSNGTAAQKFYMNIPTAQPVLNPGYYIQVINADRGGLLNIEKGPVQADTRWSPDLGWHSAMWVFETMDNGAFRIANRWKGTYLNIENGPVESTAIGFGAWSSWWIVEKVKGTDFVTIRSKWKPNLYLQLAGNKVICDTIEPGQRSARWRLNYFAKR